MTTPPAKPGLPFGRPRAIRRTGDDRPAGSIWSYIRRMTGKSQAAACGLAVVVTFLNLVPIELQRRMIDNAIVENDLMLLLLLGGIYLASILALQAAKLSLNMMQGWLSESATLYTRQHLWSLRRGERSTDDKGRDIVSVLTTETEGLGNFAGTGPSNLMANASMLIGALAYMFYVAPVVAAAGLLLIAPQAFLAPLMQRRLNRYVAIRLRLMRRFTASLDRGEAPNDEEIADRVRRLFRNQMGFFFWKFLMKAGLNILNAIAPLGVIVVGGWMVIEGQTTIGVVVAFVGGFSQIGDPIRQLISLYREAAQARVRHDLVASWMHERV